MKKIIIVLCIFTLSACSKNVKTVEYLSWPNNKSTIYISTDLHYQVNDSVGKHLYLDEIIDTLLYETSGKVLLLAGDLTNSGNFKEHQALIDKLNIAKDSGTNIYVTMGNHDVGKVSNDDLMNLYHDFGYSEAISVDDDSMSYLAPLNDDILILSIDTTKKSSDSDLYASYLSNDTLAYIEESIIYALNNNKMIIPFGHYNLLNHAVGDLHRHYSIENNKKLLELFTRYGIPIYLSGHRHNSFIESVDDFTFNEIVTDIPTSYLNRYTRLEFNLNYTIDYSLEYLDINNYANINNLEDSNLLNYDEYSLNEYNKTIEHNAELNTNDFDISEIDKDLMKEYFIKINWHFKHRTINENMDILLHDPALDMWSIYKDDNIYGRWMPWILQNQNNDQANKILGPYR